MGAYGTRKEIEEVHPTPKLLVTVRTECIAYFPEERVLLGPAYNISDDFMRQRRPVLLTLSVVVRVNLRWRSSALRTDVLPRDAKSREQWAALFQA